MSMAWENCQDGRGKPIWRRNSLICGNIFGDLLAARLSIRLEPSKECLARMRRKLPMILCPLGFFPGRREETGPLVSRFRLYIERDLNLRKER